MLLSAFPSPLSSGPSQLAQLNAVDNAPCSGPADEDSAAPASPADTAPSESHGAMEVGAAAVTFCFHRRDLAQDLSLAPSGDGPAPSQSHDSGSVSPGASGPSGDDAAKTFAADNSIDSGSPAAAAAALPAALDVAAPLHADANAQTPAAQHVLSPAAPMSLFSPTAGAETAVSPSAVWSYAQAAEALGQVDPVASDVTSPDSALASGIHQQSDVSSHSPLEEQLDDPLNESGGSAR